MPTLENRFHANGNPYKLPSLRFDAAAPSEKTIPAKDIKRGDKINGHEVSKISISGMVFVTMTDGNDVAFSLYGKVKVTR